MAEARFCNIYQCINMKTGELLILKSYPTMRNNSNFLSEIKKVRKEARILNKLNHKNIIKLYQTETSNENIQLIMECIPGGCLEEIISKYKVLEEEIIKNYLKQIIEVVKFLSSLGIAHNNIKAEKVFITSAGVLKLSGFKNFTSKNEEFNENDLIYNKVKNLHQFLAPEVLDGQEPNTASDVWSIGCLAIQLSSGKEPFYYLSADNDQVLKILASKKFVINYPKVSTVLRSFIELCLKLEPTSRPDVNDLAKHELFTGKQSYFNFLNDDSSKFSLSKTTDSHRPIAELDNE